MGQQQLLLIVLGVIVVGIAIVVGINLFNAHSVSSNRDAVLSDLNNIASMAMSYYKKPAATGGGGNSFAGFDIPDELKTTGNGTYTISSAGSATGITFQGVGNEKVGGNNVTYTLAVSPTGPEAATQVY